MSSADRTAPDRAPRGGLRLRLTLASTALLALIAGLLFALSYLLVGRIVTALPLLPPGTPVMVGGQLQDAAEVTARVVAQGRRTVVLVGVVGFPLVVITGAALSWVLIGRALRPLATLTRATRVLSESSLDQRISLSGPRDEVAELADTFDEMLDRLQAAFDAERRFVANASHELRTPLAVIRTEVDVTLADPDTGTGELIRMAEVVRDAADQANDLLGALLVLARSQGAGVSRRAPVDIATLIGPALAAVEAERAERELSVTVDTRPAPVNGDPALLARLVGNLVENAVRHNVPGGYIRVTAASTQDETSLVVDATGSEVDPDAAAQLFEPFRQGARARTGRGAGLGLSIVRAVARAHGGEATATARPGGGLTVTVVLPVSGAARG